MRENNVYLPSENESYLVGKTKCPQCSKFGRDRTGDNLALYNDGHVFCFSCRYYKPSNPRMVAKQKIKMELSSSLNEKSVIKLPSDTTIALDSRAGMWLAKYDITKDEVLKDGLLWSNNMEGLIFPFYKNTPNSGVILEGYQVRTFVKGRPKYITIGPRDEIFWYHGLQHAKKHGIILVEDCVSAMKVGRQACTVPLLGANISKRKQIDLYKTSEILIFWLDYDKADEAYKYASHCASLGYTTKVIVTKDDPKVYLDTEVKEILDGVDY